MQQIKVGVDIHGVIDAFPMFFSVITKLLVDTGHEVHILTGSHETPGIHEELKSYGIKYTHFFSISDYNKQIGTKIWYDSKGTPWMDQTAWNKTKGEYCLRNKIDFHVDDTMEYGDYFKTPFARFFSKHVEKRVREGVLPNEVALKKDGIINFVISYLKLISVKLATKLFNLSLWLLRKVNKWNR